MSPAAFDAAYNNEPSLTAFEHQTAMRDLRAKETPEQLRRAERMVSETRGFKMPVRVKLASEFLVAPYSGLTPEAWNKAFERALHRLRYGTEEIPGFDD